MSEMKELKFFILIGICTSILFSSGHVENPDTHLRLTQARLLTENFEFGFPDDTGEDFQGNIAVNSSGKRHMVYNPGQTLIFYPIYSFFKTLNFKKRFLKRRISFMHPSPLYQSSTLVVSLRK